MQPNPPITPRLEPVLRRLRQRIRRVRASRGALITAVTALTGLLALVAIDCAFAPLPTIVRWLCPLAWLALVTSVAAIGWVLPLRQPLDLVRIARWLEIRHPEMDERISTVLEVSGHRGGGMSAGLLDVLAREAAIDLVQIDPLLEVSTRRTRYWLWPAAGLLAVWVVLFALWPSLTVRHVVRALVPTSTLGTVGSIAVTPGSLEVIEGEALTLTARHSAGANKPLELVLHLPDGSTSVLPMAAREAGWVYQMGKAGQSFKYEVRAGRETSNTYQITVWPRPRLADARVRLEFPVYTGWAAREQVMGGGLTAIVGSKLELRAKLNTPVEAARLEVNEHTAGVSTLERAADGGTLALRWTLEKPGQAATRVMLQHRLGREFEAARFTVESRPDAPPDVKWLSPTDKELHLRPDDLLESGYSVNDDVGLRSVQLEVQLEKGDAARLPLATPPRSGSTEPPAWRGRVSQAIGVLVTRWPQVRVFKLRVRAEDNRPADLGGPGVGTSGWLTLRLDDGAQSSARQEVAAAHADVRDTIEQARQAVQQAQEKIDRRRPELQNEKLTADGSKDMAQARDQLAQAHDKLERLAERLPESVHGDKVPEVRQAAATVEQARQKLENAPLQDTAKERDQSAAAARDTAVKAEQQLEKLRDEIQRSEPQTQDFARLKELQQQQAEVARQAEAALANSPPDPTQPNKPAEPWQQKQANVAEAIRQDAQQQPQAQAAALEHQARQAQQLAAEAKQQAANQDTLKQLDANPTNPTNPPESSDSSQTPADLSAQRAEQAAALAEEIRQTPQVNSPSGPMQQAAQSSQQAAAQAKQAAQTDAQGKPAEASASHGQAAQQLEQASAQLAQAAAEFSQQAAQAAARQPSPQQAPIPGQPLADAFQQAAQAATSKSPATAASEARSAAQALAKAAEATLQAMQGPPSGKPGQPAPPNQPGQPTPPGTPADDSLRNPQADPGVPPELAKLGVSAADWEKIKASLKSEVGGASAIAMPEEYRDLVRRYFEQISKSSPP
ncbi:MAG: DUF4175 family protein [Verrucomicrobiota bacterium]